MLARIQAKCANTGWDGAGAQLADDAGNPARGTQTSAEVPVAHLYNRTQIQPSLLPSFTASLLCLFTSLLFYLFTALPLKPFSRLPIYAFTPFNSLLIYLVTALSLYLFAPLPPLSLYLFASLPLCLCPSVAI